MGSEAQKMSIIKGCQKETKNIGCSEKSRRIVLVALFPYE